MAPYSMMDVTAADLQYGCSGTAISQTYFDEAVSFRGRFAYYFKGKGYNNKKAYIKAKNDYKSKLQIYRLRSSKVCNSKSYYDCKRRSVTKIWIPRTLLSIKQIAQQKRRTRLKKLYGL